jgi:ring-1,2-phenylacetyl-CoA epoxidase subunit PaaE
MITFRVIKIIPETKDASTFVLLEINDQPVSYEAGQFLTFVLSIKDHEIRRSYSICSTPGIDEHIAVTIKRVNNGEVSRWLLDNTRPGSILRSLAPAGKFTIETQKDEQRDFIFIAAGNGITPVFSLIKKVLHEEQLSTVTLIFQNRDENSIIFDQQLEHFQKIFSRQFHWISLLSDPLDKRKNPQRLNNIELEKLVMKHIHFNRKDALFYICGPKAFMRMAQFTLRVMGFEELNIKKENFEVDYVPPPFFSIDPSPKKLTIYFGNETYIITVKYPENILQAALNNNIQLPYSCRGGRCSSCVARCLSGYVKMTINEVLTSKDLDEGLVLTCVGYAATDVVLKF